jgi:hypothetical protein
MLGKKATRTCFGDAIPQRKDALVPRHWKTQIYANQTGTIASGTAVALASRTRNINHAKSILSWYSKPEYSHNLTLVYQVKAAWFQAPVQLAADTFEWRLLKLDQRTTICSQGDMYQNTFARNMNKVEGDRITMVRDDLRRTAMKHLAKTNQTGSERRRRVAIYAREDSKWRNIKNAGALVDLFDDNRFEVTVHTRIPASFWEQVAFFAGIDLLIAPNGGWVPNVSWLPLRRVWRSTYTYWIVGFVCLV